MHSKYFLLPLKLNMWYNNILYVLVKKENILSEIQKQLKNTIKSNRRTY